MQNDFFMIKFIITHLIVGSVFWVQNNVIMPFIKS